MGMWLPQSDEKPADFPIFFHYVNVGPNVREEEMITDVYLPLKEHFAQRHSSPAWPLERKSSDRFISRLLAP
jgi:hypothetical protein